MPTLRGVARRPLLAAFRDVTCLPGDCASRFSNSVMDCVRTLCRRRRYASVGLRCTILLFQNTPLYCFWRVRRQGGWGDLQTKKPFARYVSLEHCGTSSAVSASRITCSHVKLAFSAWQATSHGRVSFCIRSKILPAETSAAASIFVILGSNESFCLRISSSSFLIAGSEVSLTICPT